jgi:hypothetical protein
MLATVAVRAGSAPDALAPIFNGKDLTGWTFTEMTNFWRVEQGAHWLAKTMEN